MSEIKLNGYKLVVSPISPLAPKAIEIQYRKNNPEPKCPTYTVEAFAGVVETFEYDETSIQDATVEEKESFIKWQEEHNAWASELSFKVIKLFLSKGVDLKLTKKQEKELQSLTEIIDLELPENEKDRHVFYLQTFIFHDQKDMQKIMKAVLAETGIEEESLSAADDLFRN